MIRNYIKIALKVLLRKKLYTIITLFCISVTLSIVIIVSSFAEHVRDTVPPQSKFKLTMNLIGFTVYAEKDGIRTQTSNYYPTYHFIDKYVKTLHSPLIVSAHSIFDDDIEVIRNDTKRSFRVKYTDAEFWQITDFEFTEGRPFTNDHVAQQARVVIIDMQTRDYFFPSGESAVGKSISIGDKAYTVSGVVRNVDELKLVSSNIYFPITVSERYTQNSIRVENGNCAALVLAKSKKDFKKIKAEYQQMLRKLEKDIEGDDWFNHISSYIEPGYLSFIKPLIRNPRAIEKAPYIVSVLLILFILLYLNLPASNLANIQLNRIYERHDEIGVRKTFGANKSNLVMQFIIENIIITLIGTVFALFITVIFILLFNASGIIPGIHLRINHNVLIFSIILAFCFALLSGIAPALRMSRLPIATILKNDE